VNIPGSSRFLFPHLIGDGFFFFAVLCAFLHRADFVRNEIVEREQAPALKSETGETFPEEWTGEE
jgi:hypothetical protein